MIKSLLCAAALAVAPLAASAAVIEPGDADSLGATLMPGGFLAFLFEPTEEMTFNFITAATGTSLADLQAVTFGYSPVKADDVGFASFYENVAPGLSAAVGFLPSITTQLPFYVYFFDGVSSNVGVTLSYNTAPVPLPAAGGLLLLALAGVGGAAAMRRRSE